jgi:hypothetical protein
MIVFDTVRQSRSYGFGFEESTLSLLIAVVMKILSSQTIGQDHSASNFSPSTGFPPLVNVQVNRHPF